MTFTGTANILSIGTSVPALGFSQSEVLARMNGLGFGQSRAARVIFGRAGVNKRHMVIDERFYGQRQSTQARNERYLQEAMPLGEAAICRALDGVNLPPEAIDEFIVVSCTGFDIPGLDLRLAGRLGMRADLRRTCVLGMGCYGAFPALLRAQQAAAGGDKRIMVMALELCSVHFQLEETIENIVSAALFADGASAALIGKAEGGGLAPEILDSATYCDYSTLDQMAFHVTDEGFHMRLSSYVPDLLAANIDGFVDGFLARSGLTRDQVRLWGVHPGSSKILDFVQGKLGLTDGQMAASRTVLREYGNMSSATILFVLDEIQREGEPRSGDYGVLLGFGPGLTSEAILVRW